MKAVIYARVSSKEQEREGFSIPAQLKLLAEYAQKKGLQVAKEFVDVESAKGAGRVQFGEMVKFLCANKDVKAVLVEKTDRLYRNFKDYVILEDLGLSIHCVKEGEIINKEAQSHIKFIHGIKVLMAKNFIDNLSEETKKGMQSKAEQGLWPSYAPFGYRNVNKVIEPDPEEAPIIRQLFAWYATGNYSLSTLRSQCKQTFLHSRLLARSYIERVLKNPLYYGDFVWDGKYYEGKHAPLVSKELWNTVQEVFKKVSKPRKTKRCFPFSGMLTCAHCGCTITAEIKKSRYIYYFCTGARGPCSRPRIRQEGLEEKFGEVVRGIVIPDRIVDWLMKALEENQRDRTSHNKAMLKRAKAEETAVDSKVDLLLDDRLQGKIPEDLCYQKINQLRSKQASLREQIELFEKGAAGGMPDNAFRIIELANKAHDLYLKQDPSKKGTLLRHLLSNSTWDGVSVYPTYRKPFDMIAEGVKSGDWLPREDSNL